MDDLLPTILTSFATTMATKGAEAPAHTFNEAWKYFFGGVNSFLMRANLKREVNDVKYAQSFIDKAFKIPDEQLQEPKLSIIGPALEASKFYIDEEEIREMFASLLAASFDSSKNDILHHSYIEIIKQLSPLDAKNLRFIFDNKKYPIAKYSSNTPGTYSYKDLKTNVFLPEHDVLSNELIKFIDNNSSSISNLERLGLIFVDRINPLADDSLYHNLEHNQLVDFYKELLHEKNLELDITKQSVSMTPFGKNFCSICIY